MRVAAAAMLLGIALGGGSRVAPEAKEYRFEREVSVATGAAGTVCARLDGTLYAHSPTLGDVRLLAGGREVPYALLTSQADAESEPAKVLHLHAPDHGGQIDFDLEMPARAYSAVKLDLAGQNFVATAKVSGLTSETHKALGTFALFDLAGQGLGRDTTLALGESDFPILHVELTVTAATGNAAANVTVRGAEVPPSREAQTIFTTVAMKPVAQAGNRSIAEFELPAHVPVERASFDLAPEDKTNFRRSVQIIAKTDAAPPEEIGGEISRVQMTVAGHDLRERRLSVAAVLGSNARDRARVEVAVENNGEPPLAIRAVRLEMRERRLCFDAPGEPVTMFYGDGALGRPAYDYARTFRVDEVLGTAELGPEQANPAYAPPAARPSLLERPPKLLWLELLGLLGLVGGMVALGWKRVGSGSS